MANGYKVFHVIDANGKRKAVKAHRFLWELYNGPIPKGMQIDHINGNKKDNRLENLRLATNQQNGANIKIGDFTNIRKHRKKWTVYITHNCSQNFYGCHESLELAQLVRDVVRDKLFGEFSGRWQDRRGN